MARAAAAALAALAAVAAAALGVLAWSQGEPPAGAATPAPPARQQVEPSKDALDLVAQVRARWMGVDHAGNLWAWEALEGSVR
ncbi:MAG: hypothetical protein JOZ15_20660, partial [Acidobacteria bacterium]|nr:hypothetical protein [Acidobacteriota bacterium]